MRDVMPDVSVRRSAVPHTGSMGRPGIAARWCYAWGKRVMPERLPYTILARSVAAVNIPMPKCYCSVTGRVQPLHRPLGDPQA